MQQTEITLTYFCLGLSNVIQSHKIPVAIISQLFAKCEGILEISCVSLLFEPFQAAVDAGSDHFFTCHPNILSCNESCAW